MKIFYSLFFGFNHHNAFNKIIDIHQKIITEEVGCTNYNNSYLYSNETDSILHNQYYKSPFFRKVRMTQFYDSKKEKYMINSIWYPHYQSDVPILSIDVAKFHKGAGLCFLNLGEIKKNKYSYLFDAYLKKNKQFVEKKTNHLQSLDGIVSDSMVYSHIYDGEKMEKIPDLVNDYIHIYLSIFNIIPFTELENNKENEKENELEVKGIQERYDVIRKRNEKNFIYSQYFDKSELDTMIDTMF